jgi:Basic region leucine zipper
MPPSNLQGLNIVHPAQDSGDSHDLLLGQAYPDLTAQLDLWTNLAFDSDEPLGPRHDEHKNAAKSISEEEEEEEARSPVTGEKAVHDGHVNVVTPANVPVNQNPNHTAAAQSANLFDINSFLNSFGIDAFTAHPSQLQRQATSITPSLAQLLALNPPHVPTFGAGLPQYIADAAAPPSFARPASIPEEEPYVPMAKRARTRRVSVTSTESPDFREESLPPNPNLSPAEDKRRRNTAASARFRLKKKEREAALEGKAKELETKVNELERECEGLRRENGWLKGLVVGVTGAAQGPTSTGLTVSSPPPLTITTGSKRRREESVA